MQTVKLETQTAQVSPDAAEQTPVEPQLPADLTDAGWSEEVLAWAIASSTCGGLPHPRQDEQDRQGTAAQPKAQGEKPACP